MDERIERKKRVVAKVDEGVWCLVRTSGRSALARLQGIKALDDSNREQIDGCLRKNSGVLFDVVLDYFSPIQRVPIPGPDGKLQINQQTGQPLTGMGRETIVTNFEFVTDPCPIRLFGIECLIPLQDMTDGNKHLAEQLIEEALATLNNRRAQESNIALPQPGQGVDAAIQAAIAAAMMEGKPLPPGVTRLPDENGKPHFKIDLREANKQ
jgi:hypothetical protein